MVILRVGEGAATEHEALLERVSSFFEGVEAAKLLKQERASLEAEFEERKQAGTLTPDFLSLADSVFSRTIKTSIMILLEKYDDPQVQDRILILAESAQTAESVIATVCSEPEVQLLPMDSFTVTDGHHDMEGDVIDNPIFGSMGIRLRDDDNDGRADAMTEDARPIITVCVNVNQAMLYLNQSLAHGSMIAAPSA